jgi:hypothetical protein
MHCRWLIPALIALTACPGPPEAEDERYELIGTWVDVPDRVGDPVDLGRVTLQREVLDADGGWIEAPLCGTGVEDSPYGCEPEYEDPTPRVINAIGAAVELVPLVDGQGRTWAWAVTEPGDYVLIGIEEVPEASFAVPTPFTVEDWGEATDFDPLALEGKTYTLEGYHTWPTDFGPTVSGEHPPILVEFFDVTASSATMRAIAREVDRDCVLLVAEGAFSGSEWSWSEDSISATDADLGEIFAEDVHFSVAWKSGTLVFADARGDARIDTAPLAPMLGENAGPGAVCDAMGVLGAECVTCDNGSAYCAELHGHDGELAETSEVLPDLLPLCGLDVPDANLSCDIDLGCSTAGPRFGFVGMWAGLLVLLRRRKQA